MRKTVLIAGLAICGFVSVLAEAADSGDASPLEPGRAAERKGDLDGTIKLMTAALGRPDLSAADRAEAYTKRGDAYREQGDDKAALADLEAALKLDPSDADAYLERGLIEAKQGQADPAKADYAKSVSLAPNLAATWFNEATAFHHERGFAPALRAIDKVMVLTPDDPVAHNERGVLQAMLGHGDEALAEYDKAIALKPDYPEAFYNRGLVEEDQGKYQPAVDDFSKLIRLKSNYAPAYESRGLDRFALGDFKGAADDFERGLALDPSVDLYRVLWLHLARARQNIPDADELDRNLSRFDRNRWPGPVATLFLGKATPADIEAAATKGDEQDLSDQRCDAAFYLGEFDLIHNDAVDAERKLRQAIDACRADSFERFGASTELKRIKG